MLSKYQCWTAQSEDLSGQIGEALQGHKIDFQSPGGLGTG